jgi:hypothetical protein
LAILLADQLTGMAVWDLDVNGHPTLPMVAGWACAMPLRSPDLTVASVAF